MKSGNRISLLRRAGRALWLSPLAFGCAIASAQQSPALDNVSIWLGGYYAKTDTFVGASDKSGQYHGRVGLEDDLGFSDHKTSPRARIDFLIGDHQGFSIDYYSIDRSRTKTLSRDISYGGNNYLASASVTGKLNFDFGSAAYRWWFGSGSDVFGLGLGGAYYGVHAGIRGDASLNAQSVEASTSTSERAWAPMLQLGWRHAFNDSLRMYVDASGVKKNGGKLAGHIYNVALGMEWFPWKNLGIGAEYGYTRIKLNQSHHDFNDDLDMKLTGPSAFVRLRF